MAKVLTGPMISEIRGKCADVVFSRNRGGMFSRRHGVRVKPWSQCQIDVRTYGYNVGLRWNADLTMNQRLGWNALATELNKHDQLKQTISLTGQQVHFARNYALSWWVGIFLDDAPEQGSPLTPPPVVVTTATASPQALWLNFARHPAANESFCLTCTNPLNPGVNNPGHRFAWLDSYLIGDTLPGNSSNGYSLYHAPMVTGQILFLLVRSINHTTGVLSTPIQTITTIS